MTRSIITALFTLMMADAALAECWVARFGFHRGQTSDTTMTVTSGASCGVLVYAGGRSRFDSVAITAAPRNGTLSPRSGVGVTYRSKTGYHGTDTFAFAVTGRLASGQGTATIRVNVTVR